MAENYESAALRHFKDAAALQSSGELDNAGHLFGFAAECAIKHKIASLRSPAETPHVHFPDLVNVARKQFRQRSQDLEMYQILQSAIFIGWHVNRRYEETGSTGIRELAQWVAATKNIFRTAGIKVQK
jgi:hypothetical protein